MKKNKIVIFFCVVIIVLFISNLICFVKNTDIVKNKLFETYLNSDLKSLKAENDNLKSILKIKKLNENIVVFRAYMINPYESFVGITNNKKIKTGDPVYSEAGLIGFVKKIYRNEILIESLNVTKSKISVVVNDKYGLISCDKNNCTLEGLLSTDIKKGDIVYTSGLAKAKKGMKVGVITKIDNKDSIFKTKATIDINASYKKLNYLFIEV